MSNVNMLFSCFDDKNLKLKSTKEKDFEIYYETWK